MKKNVTYINRSGAEIMTIKEAREQVGMSRTEVAEWLEIPYRTLQNWEIEERKCPPYVEKLIVEKILSKKPEGKE